MENKKINIAELLKDCPKGTKLYSPIFGEVYLDNIRPHLAIIVTTDKYKEEFLYDGRYGMNGECMLFPSKDQRDWSKFQQPFKDGDVIYVCDEYSGATFTYVVILKQIKGGQIYSYCFYSYKDAVFGTYDFLYNNYNIRLATEEEKTKLFQTIKDNGYKWNAETKTLEKLIEPKFKVGDKIKNKYTCEIVTVKRIYEFYYIVVFNGTETSIDRKLEEHYELVSNKFDINTLKPFESKVLVRDINSDNWIGAFYSHYKPRRFYTIGNSYYYQCIPYEGNEHLLGTSNDCDEFYKNW